jgi:PIN domain nuclease of toxin-antitoxin system
VILLDTHVLVWLASDPRKLSRTAAAAIRRALRSGGLNVASITLWELAVLFTTARLRTAGTAHNAIVELVEATSASVREITPEIAAIAAQLPDAFPRDPADRLIAASALALGCPLVTADARIAASELVRVIW